MCLHLSGLRRSRSRTRNRIPWPRPPEPKAGAIRGFHISDARLGSVRIFDALVKIQHDAQWRASNYRSRLITDFLMHASKFCRRITNVKTPIHPLALAPPPLESNHSKPARIRRKVRACMGTMGVKKKPIKKAQMLTSSELPSERILDISIFLQMMRIFVSQRAALLNPHKLKLQNQL